MLMKHRRFLSGAAVAVLFSLLAACAGTGPGMDEKAAMEKQAMEEKAMMEKEAMAKPSLYDRLGGKDAITAVVDDFVGNVAADERINGFFTNTNIPRFKVLLVEQICAGSGGPCTYTGRDMRTAHAGMGVTEQDFNALVEDLVKSLNKFNVPQPEQDDLLAVLGPMKSDIVTR